ncbi:MAG: hypothetical protein K0R54_367 [Clostridiaceae bacterium]|jgi:hypothetical protein|nr:hypothetical protein [Clostridiaceae bacterium]
MKNKNIEMLEECLSKPVSSYFVSLGYTVRSEVNYCDICALKDDNLIIIELKRNLSVDLLVQAVDRQKITDLVYIAIPKPKKLTGNAKWKSLCHLIKRLELGLILVSFVNNESYIEIPIDPLSCDRQKFMKSNRKRRDSIINEIHGRNLDLNTGGSKGKKLVTAYREESLYIGCCLKMNGALSPKKLKELGSDSKKTQSILSKNYYGWFLRVAKGKYCLTHEGEQALITYKDLAKFYYDKINNLNKQ